MPNDPPPLPDIPTSLAVSSRNSNSLIITWAVAANANSYELEISWNTETKKFPASSPQKIEDLLSTASLVLFSNRIYKIRVRAINSEGNSNWSNWLTTATPPPIPTHPSADSLMIETDVKLSWNVSLAANVDITFPLFVEIARKELDGTIKTLPTATNMSLQGNYIDKNPLAENLYFIRLYSNLPAPVSRNISEWSSAYSFRKQVFAKLEIPRIQENNALRNKLIKRYYYERR